MTKRSQLQKRCVGRAMTDETLRRRCISACDEKRRMGISTSLCLSCEARLLRAALTRLVGAETRSELEQMEAFLRSAPVPDEDKWASINAIQALLVTGDD